MVRNQMYNLHNSLNQFAGLMKKLKRYVIVGIQLSINDHIKRSQK